MRRLWKALFWVALLFGGRTAAGSRDDSGGNLPRKGARVLETEKTGRAQDAARQDGRRELREKMLELARQQVSEAGDNERADALAGELEQTKFRHMGERAQNEADRDRER